MKYKFEQFNVEITDPSVEVMNVSDSIGTKTCSVDVKLTTESAEFCVNFQGFEYLETWEDADIHLWVEVELQKHVI